MHCSNDEQPIVDPSQSDKHKQSFEQVGLGVVDCTCVVVDSRVVVVSVVVSDVVATK